jgi:hypothetical protein
MSIQGELRRFLFLFYFYFIFLRGLNSFPQSLIYLIIRRSEKRKKEKKRRAVMASKMIPECVAWLVKMGTCGPAAEACRIRTTSSASVLGVGSREKRYFLLLLLATRLLMVRSLSINPFLLFFFFFSPLISTDNLQLQRLWLFKISSASVLSPTRRFTSVLPFSFSFFFRVSPVAFAFFLSN